MSLYLFFVLLFVPFNGQPSRPSMIDLQSILKRKVQHLQLILKTQFIANNVQAEVTSIPRGLPKVLFFAIQMKERDNNKQEKKVSQALHRIQRECEKIKRLWFFHTKEIRDHLTKTEREKRKKNKQLILYRFILALRNFYYSFSSLLLGMKCNCDIRAKTARIIFSEYYHKANHQVSTQTITKNEQVNRSLTN